MDQFISLDKDDYKNSYTILITTISHICFSLSKVYYFFIKNIFYLKCIISLLRTYIIYTYLIKKSIHELKDSKLLIVYIWLIMYVKEMWHGGKKVHAFEMITILIWHKIHNFVEPWLWHEAKVMHVCISIYIPFFNPCFLCFNLTHLCFFAFVILTRTIYWKIYFCHNNSKVCIMR